MKERYITLSQKQLKRLRVLHAYVDKRIDRKRAAELLSLSERQISRLKKGLVIEGEMSLVHKNTGKKPAHALSGEIKKEILRIYRMPEHNGVNFSHFQDILAEKPYNISISYTPLSNLLKSCCNESPLKKRRNPLQKKMRERKSRPGELIQIDASPYEWFGGKSKFALHAGIDDAEGKIVGMYMTESECLTGYYETMRQCISINGVPQSAYSDKHTIFRSPKAGLLTTEEIIMGKTVNLTQFGRSMHELGVDIIYASTPQAKGRIERLWATLQSRLPVEFARRGIKTMDAANKFLAEEYIHLFNAKFAVEPKDASIFVRIAEGIDIDNYLCIKKKRKTDSAGVFSFAGSCFQILDGGYPLIPQRKEIEVLVSPRYGIRISYKGRIFDTVKYVKPMRKDAALKITPKIKRCIKPYLAHGSDAWKMIWHGEDYNLSLKFLYDLFLREDAC
jgi:hypothetical protein